MKILILNFIFVLVAFVSNSQTNTSQNNGPVYFAQCMVNITSQNDLVALENQLRAIPYVGVVRVDIPTHRLFLVTRNLSALTPADFASWMGAYATSYTCLQIGLHGVDPMNPYPFTNCSEN